jgi:predicted negative regulator of RcsB-dependent stress response
MAAALAAAGKDPGGDALIKVAEQQWSAGNGKDAVATAKSGMGKPLKDKDQAAIVLGLAQISAGQSADAVKTLSAEKGDGNGPMIAHLYGLYAAHPTGSASAAPAAATKKKK